MRMIKILILMLALLMSSCHRSPSFYPTGYKMEYSDTTVRKDTLIMFLMSGGTFDLDIKVLITSNIPLALYLVNSNLPQKYTLEDFQARGVTFYDDSYPPILWLPYLPKTTEDWSVVNHEIFHAATRILKWAGVELTDDTEEVYAFEIQYVSKQFYDKITNKNEISNKDKH